MIAILLTMLAIGFSAEAEEVLRCQTHMTSLLITTSGSGYDVEAESPTKRFSGHFTNCTDVKAYPTPQPTPDDCSRLPFCNQW